MLKFTHGPGQFLGNYAPQDRQLILFFGSEFRVEISVGKQIGIFLAYLIACLPLDIAIVSPRVNEFSTHMLFFCRVWAGGGSDFTEGEEVPTEKNEQEIQMGPLLHFFYLLTDSCPP